jgi:hypothetical protein
MSRSKPEPEDRPAAPRRERAAGRRALLRADLPSAAAVGALMGLVAGQEGSGLAVALVVAVAGCAAVLGLLALKRAFYGP